MLRRNVILVGKIPYFSITFSNTVLCGRPSSSSFIYEPSSLSEHEHLWAAFNLLSAVIFPFIKALRLRAIIFLASANPSPGGAYDPLWGIGPCTVKMGIEPNTNSSQWVRFPQSSRSTFQAEQNNCYAETDSGEYTGVIGLHLVRNQLLAIPATSTASERVFSVCGNILTERRCRMQPETLEKLLFLKYRYNM